MSPATPTTSRNGPRAPSMLKRSPRGLRPGQCRCAIVSLMTTVDGTLRMSCSFNGRPATMGMPRVRKNSGQTKFTDARSARASGSLVRSASVISETDTRPPSGTIAASVADRTPGTLRVLSIKACSNATARSAL